MGDTSPFPHTPIFSQLQGERGEIFLCGVASCLQMSIIYPEISEKAAFLTFSEISSQSKGCG